MADITEATVLGESTLIPYMRRQDVAFDANNLRPQKIARLFFDDIVMNGYSQRGNKITLNSKKLLVINPNATYTAANTDYLYQGTSNVSPTFSAIVETYYSGNTPISRVTSVHRASSADKNFLTSSSDMLASANGPILAIRPANSLSASSKLTS